MSTDMRQSDRVPRMAVGAFGFLLGVACERPIMWLALLLFIILTSYIITDEIGKRGSR